MWNSSICTCERATNTLHSCPSDAPYFMLCVDMNICLFPTAQPLFEVTDSFTLRMCSTLYPHLYWNNFLPTFSEMLHVSLLTSSARAHHTWNEVWQGLPFAPRSGPGPLRLQSVLHQSGPWCTLPHQWKWHTPKTPPLEHHLLVWAMHMRKCLKSMYIRTFCELVQHDFEYLCACCVLWVHCLCTLRPPLSAFCRSESYALSHKLLPVRFSIVSCSSLYGGTPLLCWGGPKHNSIHHSSESLSQSHWCFELIVCTCVGNSGWS